MRNNNNNNNNFRRGNRKFVGNQSAFTPDAPYYSGADINSIRGDYTLRSKARFDNKVNLKSTFNNVRNYDLVLDRVKVTIAGAAPIYGNLNPLKEWVFGDGSKGTFTASLDRAYIENEFNSLYMISRNVYFNYRGCDYLYDSASSDLSSLKDSQAFRLEREAIETSLFYLEAAQTYDLKILEAVPTKRYGTFYDIVDPISVIMHQYQHELQLYVMYVATFDRLRSMLPLLQSLDYNNQTHWARVESELKRSRFTSAIKDISSTLKRRWIDKTWIKDIMLPFMVWSKKTDGLNSPILTLLPTIATPYVKFKLNETAGSPEYSLCKWGVTPDTREGTTIPREMNYFSLEELVDAIVVKGSESEKIQRIEDWIQAQMTQLTIIRAQLTDWVRNPLVRALETMLSKLTTEPGGLNWEQNISPNELPEATSFVDWEIVNTLIQVVNTTPVLNANGYTMKLPLYQYDGFDSQLIKTHFQYYYLDSNLQTVGFVKLGRIITNVFRDGHKTYLKVNQSESNVYLQVTDAKGNRIKEDPNYASRVFQETFPALVYANNEGHDTYIVNPQLLMWLPVNMTNASSEALLWLKRTYLITLA